MNKLQMDPAIEGRPAPRFYLRVQRSARPPMPWVWEGALRSLLLNHKLERIGATYGVHELSAATICSKSSSWPVIEQQALRQDLLR
jgi:hypothetical protein